MAAPTTVQAGHQAGTLGFLRGRIALFLRSLELVAALGAAILVECFGTAGPRVVTAGICAFAAENATLASLFWLELDTLNKQRSSCETYAWQGGDIGNAITDSAAAALQCQLGCASATQNWVANGRPLAEWIVIRGLIWLCIAMLVFELVQPALSSPCNRKVSTPNVLITRMCCCVKQVPRVALCTTLATNVLWLSFVIRLVTKLRDRWAKIEGQHVNGLVHFVDPEGAVASWSAAASWVLFSALVVRRRLLVNGLSADVHNMAVACIGCVLGKQKSILQPFVPINASNRPWRCPSVCKGVLLLHAIAVGLSMSALLLIEFEASSSLVVRAALVSGATRQRVGQTNISHMWAAGKTLLALWQAHQGPLIVPPAVIVVLLVASAATSVVAAAMLLLPCPAQRGRFRCVAHTVCPATGMCCALLAWVSIMSFLFWSSPQALLDVNTDQYAGWPLPIMVSEFFHQNPDIVWPQGLFKWDLVRREQVWCAFSAGALNAAVLLVSLLEPWVNGAAVSETSGITASKLFKWFANLALLSSFMERQRTEAATLHESVKLLSNRVDLLESKLRHLDDYASESRGNLRPRKDPRENTRATPRLGLDQPVLALQAAGAIEPSFHVSHNPMFDTRKGQRVEVVDLVQSGVTAVRVSATEGKARIAFATEPALTV